MSTSRILFFLLIQLVWIDLGTANESAWRAGTAKANITPKKFMWMSGYASRNKPAESKLTDLWCKVLVLESGTGKKSILITLDLIGIGRTLSVDICTAIRDRHGIQRDQVAICTSHTHTGPALADNLMPLHYLVVDEGQKKLIRQYSNQLKEVVIKTVGEAIKTLRPATVRFGNDRATFAVNRRNNPEAQVPSLREQGKLKGPIDHDVPVLAVFGEKGKCKCLVFGYACHATVLSTYQWSGDYPGFAQLELEKSHPGCQAMFWAGCGGDQNPLPRRKVELARNYGSRLAKAVDRVLDSKMEELKPDFASTYREVQLPLAKLPSREKIESDAKSANRFIQARAKFLLSQLDSQGAIDKTYPYPVQTWKLGDRIQWVFLGGEVVIDYSIRLKTENSGNHTWVAAYANDVMAYIASRRILREGGYEGGGAMIYYGLPAPWAPESEDLIVEEVNRQLKK